MRQAIGLGFESRRAQKIFSVRDILSRFYHPGQKPPELLSQHPNSSSKTGTNGPLKPGQMGQSVVVLVLYQTLSSKKSLREIIRDNLLDRTVVY